MNFYELDDLAFEMNETLEEFQRGYAEDNVSGGMVSVIAEYADARELLASFVCLGYDLDFIDLEDPIYDGYADAFIITIYENLVSCEKFKRESGYINDESDATFLLDNCNSKIIPHIKSRTVYEIHMVDDDLNDDDEYNDDDFDDDDGFWINRDESSRNLNRKKLDSTVSWDKDNEGRIHGFTARKKTDNGSYSHTYYSSKPMTEREAASMIDYLGF